MNKTSVVFYSLLFFAFVNPATGSAPPTEAHEPPCREILGLAPLLAPSTVLLFGELHGTTELPELVSDVVCHGLANGLDVTLALELPQKDQPLLDAYLASTGTTKDRAAFFKSSFWSQSFQDGRASRAMLELIDDSRRRHGDGQPLTTLFLDQPEVVRARV